MNIVTAKDAPAAVGPYSHAVETGDLVFLSGQIPLDPATMKVVEGDVEAQTRQVFSNMKAVLKEMNLTLGHIVKCTIFIKDMNDFAAINGVYAENFGDHQPARSAVEVSKLPLDVSVEIECIAEKEVEF